MQNKIFIIGLDGATFDLLLPWMQDGGLPNLQRLVQGGVSGDLNSTFPPLTGPAWSSFMTGKSPSHHGVLEFFQRREKTYRQALNSRLDIDGRSLWQYLSEAGKKVGAMGLPLTYPPEQVNGFMISGLLTPPGRRDFTYPLELLPELEGQIGKYLLRHDEKYRRSNPYPFIKEQYEILENNTHAALYLMNNKEWDVFMVHILGSDRMQHEFWHTIDPNHPQHDAEEASRLGNVIQDFFIKIDESVGRLLESLDEDTLVIIMSDHGFGPIYKFINFNTWLLEQGLLRLKGSLSTQLRYLLFKLGFNYTQMGNLVLKLGLGKRAKSLGRSRREDWQRRVFLSLNDVDWSRSQVYSMGNFGQLFVNLKGREPKGVVAPGKEYEDLIKDLIRRLQEMRDPETGQPVVEKIMRREEVYSGPYAERAPDLVFLTRNMEYKAMGLSDFSSKDVFEPVFGTTGHHRMNGILICNGPGIFNQGGKVGEAAIYDLAPTILYLMGLDVPQSMDGKVLLELFSEDFRKNHTITYSESEISGDGDGHHDLTAEEEAELASVLRDLGYVT